MTREEILIKLECVRERRKLLLILNMENADTLNLLESAYLDLLGTKDALNEVMK